MSAAADCFGGRHAAPKLVIIDLDGTLVDTVPDLAACADAMLADLGRAPCGESAVRNWVGNGVERLVKRVLTGDPDGEPDEALLQRALVLFMSHYADNVSNKSRPYPGARRILDYVQSKGIPAVCVTNKPARFTEKLLEDLNLRSGFALVLSGDSLARKKPDPMPLLHAAAHFGVPPQRCLMVGDSRTDVAAARAAGIPVVCVSYGYNHGEDIGAACPDAVIDSLEDLPAILAEGAAEPR